MFKSHQIKEKHLKIFLHKDFGNIDQVQEKIN
jgi:hypothetical protein